MATCPDCEQKGNCSVVTKACGFGKPDCCTGLECTGSFLGFGGKCQKVINIPWGIVVGALFGFLAFFVSYWFFHDPFKKFTQNWVAIGIGSVLAIILFFIMKWVVENWLLVMLVGLGAVGLYAFILIIGAVGFGGIFAIVKGKKKK